MLSISSTCFALYARSYILLYDSFNPTSECETFVVESTEVARKITAARGEVCAAPPDSTNDTNNNDNNSGIDFNQQYREWKEMMVAATGARERAEEEKQVKKKYWSNRLDFSPYNDLSCWVFVPFSTIFIVYIWFYSWIRR